MPYVISRENADRVGDVGGAIANIRPREAAMLYPPAAYGLCHALLLRRGAFES